MPNTGVMSFDWILETLPGAEKMLEFADEPGLAAIAMALESTLKAVKAMREAKGFDLVGAIDAADAANEAVKAERFGPKP